MSDSITVFGTDFTGVTGIKATGTGNGTLTYIRPAGTKSISANGTNIDVTSYASVDVAVPESTFVVTVSYNDQTEMWEPDCTWAEALAAYGAGKTFVAKGVWGTGVNADCNIRLSNESLIGIWFTIDANGFDDPTNTDTRVWYECYFDSNGFIVTDTVTFPLPEWSKTITTNGTHDVTYYASVDVAVPSSSPTLQAKTATPTTAQQTITPDSGYDGLSSVTVAAMPSGTAGTPSATKGSVSNHSVSVTPSVTNTTGYITGSTKTGTAVTVSASELVSGTYTVSASGTHDVTNYASASVAAGGATASATKGTVSNHSISVTPSVTRTAGYVTAGSANGTAVTVSASELVSGSQTITTNDTYDVTNLAQVVVDVQGGGSSGMQVATTTATPSVASSSISFTGLSGQPTSFYLTSAADLATGAAPYKVAAVTYDGTDLHGQIVTDTSNAQASYSTAFTQSYSSGTLTISSTGASFQAVQYKLVYTYGGTSANVGTAETQVGSGATSITFTGLTDEPTCFSVIFKSSFSTSSGYQRVIAVTHDGSSTYGLAMDSVANAQTSWSYTYSNGSLTVTSQGTNNGGYFHQPGYYQLTYGIGGEVEPVEIDVEPLSVTQNGTYTAPDGVAYSPVTVAVSGGGVSVGKTTWTNNSTSTVSHQFTGLSGTPKAAFLRCTSQLTRSSSNTYYYIADIVWDGTSAYGNYHLRSNGSFNDVASTAQSGFNVSVSGTSITFSSDATSRSSAPGSFYNGTYELTYIY